MTRGEIWKDFLKHTVLTLVIALFLFLIFKSVFTKNGETEYFYVWLCCGIPFGIRRMFVWLVPHGYDLGGSVGIIAVNFIIGGLIGGGHPDLASGGCSMVYSFDHLPIACHRKRE